MLNVKTYNFHRTPFKFYHKVFELCAFLDAKYEEFSDSFTFVPFQWYRFDNKFGYGNERYKRLYL